MTICQTAVEQAENEALFHNPPPYSVPCPPKARSEPGKTLKTRLCIL